MSPKFKPFSNSLILRFELWEVLTMLTVVLSIASSFLWFTSFQPKNVENQFLIVEKSKHVLHNQFLKNQQFQDQKLPEPINIDGDLGCKTDAKALAIDSSFSDKTISSLQDSQKTSQDQSANIKDLSSMTIDESSVAETIRSLESYTNKFIDLWRENSHFSSDVSRLQKKVLETCRADADNLVEKNKDLESDLNSLKEYNFDSFYSWKADLKDIVSLNEDFVSLNKNENKEVRTEKLRKYSNLLKNILTLRFDRSVSLKIVEKEESRFKNSISSVEDWEKRYVENNKGLQNKVVMILN